jgi:hypothetical protein
MCGAVSLHASARKAPLTMLLMRTNEHDEGLSDARKRRNWGLGNALYPLKPLLFGQLHIVDEGMQMVDEAPHHLLKTLRLAMFEGGQHCLRKVLVCQVTR